MSYNLAEGEVQAGLKQSLANAEPSRIWPQESAQLGDVGHRMKNRRIEVNGLVAYYRSLVDFSNVERFSRRERNQVPPLLIDGPRFFYRGVDSL